jgi:hypothetical protein
MERRIKTAILLYNELIIEDGTYHADILETGSFCPYLPPGDLSDKERIILYERDIANRDVGFTFKLNSSSTEHQLLRGKTIARFKIDYFSIFKDIDKSLLEFIKFVCVDKTSFPREARDYLNKSNFRDKQLFKDLNEHVNIKNLVVENLNHDLITSILLKSAISLDSNHYKVLLKKCSQKKDHSLVKEDIVLTKLLEISVPNFDILTINDVVKLRNDKLWQEFRIALSEISAKIVSDISIITDKREIENQVLNLITRAFSDELNKRYKKKKIYLDIGLGLTAMIPGYGLIPSGIGIASSLYENYKEHSGWYAFLMKLSN